MRIAASRRGNGGRNSALFVTRDILEVCLQASGTPRFVARSRANGGDNEGTVSHIHLHCSRGLRQDLQRGMTEQQLAEVRGGRIPDRIIMLTCGAETAHPFPCKVYVYEGSSLFDRKLSVVLEDYGGQWKVSQWL
jgi:hypothetical protein